jgi:LTXXQ motif family protein
MKALTIAAALLLTLTTSSFVLAQGPAANDPHHPPQSTTPAPAPAQPETPPSQQPGMGSMPMMNMMSGMPMMMNMMGNNMHMMHMMHMMGMMRMMGMPGPAMGAIATIDRVEGRIAFLRAELKITDAQASAWNAFAEALRTNAQKLGEVRASMMGHRAGQQQASTLAERLELQERWFLARLEGTRAIKSAFTHLYGTLSDDQKKTADELLAPHMGMMAMMPGQMEPRQMQPGQMQPGQMQPR